MGWVGATVGAADADRPAVGGHGRTVLVVGDDAEVAVALHDCLDRTYVTVCEVRPLEAAAALRACRPWPWMVIGAGGLDQPAVQALARWPTLVIWRGSAPQDLPAHALRLELFSEVARLAQQAIDAEVVGIRLAPGEGLSMPGGVLAVSPALEALVANHPQPVFAPSREFSGAATTLRAHRVPLRLERSMDGGTCLVPTGKG